METSLHRRLKANYAQPGAQYEAKLGAYRIDVLNPGELVEIQHGSLAAIRDKIAKLLRQYDVRVVKPIIAAKTIIRLDERDGREVSRRLSPKRGNRLDIFDELIFFRKVFPHPRLTLEVALVTVEETRFPGHGRRRRWRRDDYQTQDQLLGEVRECMVLRSCADLAALLPRDLPEKWHTGDLAEAAQIQRSSAQRIAYCLRHMDAVREVGKIGNARLHRFTRGVKAAS